MYQAFHDPLTALPNRALFTDRLDHALVQSERRAEGVAVLFLDLDDFKLINDSLGHETGDRLLVSVGQRITGCLRPGDTVARLGGDEFTILLMDVEGKQDVSIIVDRLIEAFREPFIIEGHELFVSASIGVVAEPPPGVGAGELLRNADLAMYKAKENGKDRYEVYEEAMHVRISERLAIERDFRRALMRGELRIHYQPIVELSTGRVVGLEALLRWEHPERGLLLPGDFLAVAEETGLILPAGRWVMREVCERVGEWSGRLDGNTPPVSVNLSARQFQHPELTEEVAAVVRDTGTSPQNLIFEIPEPVVMGYAGPAESRLAGLREMGVGLTIDEFGTGYSSLSYLRRFPVSALKIDRSFVYGLGEAAEDAVLVSSMISLARSLGLNVVAEGIENTGQLERLRELGCDLGQGHYFSAPLPADAVWDLLSGGAALPLR